MSARRSIAMSFAVFGLLAASTGAATATAPDSGSGAGAAPSGLTATRAQSLQERVDGVLAEQPGGRQVSATKVRYDGYDVTLDPRQPAAARDSSGSGATAVACRHGHMCLTVRGKTFDFYKCKTVALKHWYGKGTFNNNQTRGTVAKFYNKNGTVRWTSKAPQKGTATWDPIYKVRPC